MTTSSPSTMTLSRLQDLLNQAVSECASLSEGKNADYIPALAQVPSSLLGLAAVSPNGQIIEAGDSRYLFAIESISKIFNLSFVIDSIGHEALREKIGANPTGEPFNSVMAIELHGGKPLNPLVNAGAMATVSLIPGHSSDEIWEAIIDNLSRFAGRKLSVNDEVYKSESSCNQHNRGIAWLLQSYGFFYNDPDMIVDLYTRMCSVEVSAYDLAVMGACLINGGINPVTGERVMEACNVAPVLAEMSMSGLYDATGSWMYATGVPAKSGVGGGLVATVPKQIAFGAFSPPLDIFGNSVRAQAVIKQLISQLHLNLFAS